MTLRLCAKVLLHVWSYDFYDMTLSTEKQRCHIIKCIFLMNEIVFVLKAIKFHFKGPYNKQNLTLIGLKACFTNFI